MTRPKKSSGPSRRVQLQLSSQVEDYLSSRAEPLGMNVQDYIKYLIVRDMEKSVGKE